MPSSTTDRGTIALLAALSERGELPERVRSRIALDVLGSLPTDAGGVDQRSARSRLHLAAVRLAPSGRAYLVGTGDTTGAGVLAWEMFTGREAPPAEERARAHDVVDELHADIDDAIAAALEGRFETVADFVEALVAAAPRVAPHADVVATRPGEVAVPSLRPSVPWPRPPSVAPPPGADPLDDLEIVAPKGPASEPTDTPLVLLFSHADDDPLADAMRREGLLVLVQAPERDAVEAASLARPRCIVCDVEEPGAFDVVELLRSSPATRETPLLLLAPRSVDDMATDPRPRSVDDAATDPRARSVDDMATDPRARSVDERSSLAAFFAAADVCLEKPFRADDVARQVTALVRMRARLAPARASTALRGDLAHVAASTIVQILDLERRTGELRVDLGTRCVVLDVAAGCGLTALIDGASAPASAAVRALLRARHGSFAFTPRPALEAPPSAERLGTLLLDAAREADEEAHAESPPQKSASAR